MPIYKAWFGTIELTQEQANFLYNVMSGNSIEDSVFKFTVLLGQENVEPNDTGFFINQLMKRIKFK